jgi:DnaK suppressor protein
MAIDVKIYRQRLEKELAELTTPSETRDESQRTVTLDQQSIGRLSRMDALQQQEMAHETERRRALHVKMIEAALKRCNEGEFGYCISCGEEIAKGRLDADPSFPACTACASKGGH